jgi:hypothetical protein
VVNKFSFIPGRFNPREIAPGTHWIGISMGPRADLDYMEEWKLLLNLDSNCDSVVQPIVGLYTEYAIPALIKTTVR